MVFRQKPSLFILIGCVAFVAYCNVFQEARAAVVDAVSHEGHFEIQVAHGPVERLRFRLYGDSKTGVPLTVKNFVTLCSQSSNATAEMSYRNTTFHRIIPNFMAQGGDFTNHDGTGGKSIYGDVFDDESFKFQHSRRGVLSMANAGPNTNGSQFFITFVATPWLDKRHVVFGEVIDGDQVLTQMEARGTQSGKTTAPVVMTGCFVAPLDKAV